MKEAKIFLLLIFILSLLVRIIGTYPGFWEYHPDEPTSYITARDMIINHDINPRRFDYPAGLSLIHMIAFQSFFIPMGLLEMLFERPDILIEGFLNFQNFPGNIADDLFGQRGIKALFWSRYVTAVLGTLCVVALYIFCDILFSGQSSPKKFLSTAMVGNSYSRIIGLIAAFFLAFNFLSVLRSHYALPEMPNALFTILALIAIARLLKEDLPRNYYIAALAIGIAFAVKFQIFVLLPFAFVHMLWSIRKKSFINLFRKEVFISGFIIVATFFALNPYLPFHLSPVPVERRVESFITANEVTARRYAFGSNELNQFAPFFLYKWGIGKGVSLSILAGAVFMFFLSPIRFLLIMSAVVPFTYAFVYYGGAGAGYYVRNYATIIPLLLIFAAFLYAEVFRQIIKRNLFPKAIVVSLLLVLLFVVSWDQILSSLRLSYYWSKPWLHDITAQWAGKNLPKDVQIEESSGLVQGHMRQYGDFSNLVTWGRDASYSVTSLAEMEEEGSDFVLLVSNQIHHQTISWMNPLNFWELLSFDDVPYERLDNTYLGLSVYQMFDNTVYDAYYPIEYPNQFYIISKVPKTDAKVVRTIRAFEFDASQSALAFSSPVFTVDEGKAYQIVGGIKTSKEVAKTERSVFLRVDLYTSKKDAELTKKGAHVAVSPRKWGNTEWGELKATTIKIPKGIKYMTISFQGDKPMSYDTYLDTIEVLEIVLEERYPNIPVKPVRIPADYIYPKAIS